MRSRDTLTAAAAEALAEQIEAAMREAERYDCRRSDRYFILKWVPEVYTRIQSVMLAHHVTIPGNDFGGLQTFVEGVNGPALPRFDNLDADRWAVGLFGLVAGNERRVHVLGPNYTPDAWLQEATSATSYCQWNGSDCVEYTRSALTFSSGQFIIAVPTCFACEGYLLAGGSRNHL